MGLDMKKFFVVISLLIGSLFYAASTAIATLADIRSGETKVISKSSKESITVYTTFVNLLTIEYVRIEDNLASTDPNYTNIRKYIAGMIKKSAHNIDPQLIESEVMYYGSEKYLNEYKALFIYLFDLHHITSSSPREIMYLIDENGRLTYFEARNMFKDGDKQVFDRSFLNRFSITKEKFKKEFNRDL